MDNLIVKPNVQVYDPVINALLGRGIEAYSKEARNDHQHIGAPLPTDYKVIRRVKGEEWLTPEGCYSTKRIVGVASSLSQVLDIAKQGFPINIAEEANIRDLLDDPSIGSLYFDVSGTRGIVVVRPWLQGVFIEDSVEKALGSAVRKSWETRQ